MSNPEQSPAEPVVVGLACELIGVGGPKVHFDERVANVLEEHLEGLSSLFLKREALRDLRSVWRELMTESQVDVANSLTHFLFAYAARVGGEKRQEERLAKHRNQTSANFVRSREQAPPANAVKPWFININASDDTDH